MGEAPFEGCIFRGTFINYGRVLITNMVFVMSTDGAGPGHDNPSVEMSANGTGTGLMD